MEDKEQGREVLDRMLSEIENIPDELFGGKENKDKILSEDFDINSFLKLQIENEKIKIYLQTIKDSSMEQFKNLGSIASLCSTLLIIATFNDSIFKYNNSVKILLTVLLFVVILSIVGFYMNFNNAQENSFKLLIDSIKDEEKKKKIEDLRKENKRRIIGYIPFVASGLTVISVGFIIFLIWVDNICEIFFQYKDFGLLFLEI